MTRLLGYGTALLGIVAAPAVAVLTLVGLTGTAITCTPATDTTLAATAPLPAQARIWVALAHAACPDLPEPWIAAVINAESGFRPDFSDATTGRRGLLGIDAADWQATYGAPWDADLNHNGTPDIEDAVIHAVIGAKLLCGELSDVRAVRATHPAWVSTLELSDLDAVLLTHTLGETALVGFPSIPAAASQMLTTVRDDATAWTGPTSPTGGSAPTSAGPQADTGCIASLSSVGTVVVPPGTAADVATAVRNSLDLVGSRTGWNNKCDRLACRAYGFANSGYDSASAHWYAMVATGHAHPGDRCPPVGAFVFWATRGPDGHVSLVVQSDPTCSPDRIKVVSNDVFNNVTGYDGGVYLVTLAQIENGFVSAGGYRGWSDPVCAGSPLPAQG